MYHALKEKCVNVKLFHLKKEKHIKDKKDDYNKNNNKNKNK